MQPDDIQEKLSIFQHTEKHVQTKTLGGLVELLPLLVSIVVLSFVVGQADGFVRPLPIVRGHYWDFPGIGLIVVVFLLYLVGLVISTRWGRKVMEGKDWLMSHIPVVRTVFGVASQATNSMTSQYRFTRVVFLEWTQPNVVSLGFVTGQATRISKRGADDEVPQTLVVVYIPTVPSPTSGNLAVIMEDDLIETDMTVEEAMKLVFSGGIVLPESITFARLPRDKERDEVIDKFKISH